MLFCDKLLFLHIPKTGGISLTRYLLDILPPPVYYAREDFDRATASPSALQVEGQRHGNLAAAARTVAQHGFSLDAFPLILAVLRNPYAIEVSRFVYLQLDRAREGDRSQGLARSSSFEAFVHEPNPDALYPIESYLRLDGTQPPNLRVLRLESLDADLARALDAAGIEKTGEVPWLNASPHADYHAYYTRTAEQAVYERYRWVFDNGFYERMTGETHPFVSEVIEDRRDQAFASLHRQVLTQRQKLKRQSAVLQNQRRRLMDQTKTLREQAQRADSFAANLEALRAAHEALASELQQLRTRQDVS